MSEKELAAYFAAFENSGQPSRASNRPFVGLEALYTDALSFYEGPKLRAPEVYLSGLEISAEVPLDVGSELTVKAVQIYLNSYGYKGANGKPLIEDGTWGKDSQTALSAWQKANAGKAGISQMAVDQKRSKVWMPGNIASDMRARLALTAKGRTELAKTPTETRAATKSDARNAIPSVTGETSAGAGNVFETAANLRAILRALAVPVAAKGNADTDLVKGWQRTAGVYKLNPSISAQAGAQQVVVNASTLSTLRVKARSASSSGQTGTRTSSGTTAGATTTAKKAVTAGTLPVQTIEVQQVLRALGWAKTVAADGKFGPKTKAAWQSSATQRKLDATISGQAGAALVNVNSTTLARLQQDAALGNTNGSSTNIAPVNTKASAPAPVSSGVPVAGTMIVPTRDVQKILIALRWASTGLTDGKFGPRTQTAWQKSATNRSIDPKISGTPGGASAVVSSTTYARLERDARMGYVNPPYGPSGTGPAPVDNAATAPKSGLTKAPIGTIQDLLLQLKFSVGKKGRDGLWGPDTQKAWQQAAKNRSLDATITRASAMEAWVAPQTFQALSLAATGTAVQPDANKPPPSADDKELVPVKIEAVGTVLRGFGLTAKTLAEMVAVWKDIAKSEKLDERAKLDKNIFYAVKNTADTLSREAAIRLSIADLIFASDTSVPVSTLQDAIAFWSNYDATKKLYKVPYKPKAKGLWDADTLMWTLRYLNIQPGVATTVWERALQTLVATDKKSLKLAAKFVPQIKTDAANFKKLGAVIVKKATVDKKNDTEEKRLQALLDGRVKAATVVVSVRALQQALSELYAKFKEGKIQLPPNSPALTAVSRSGAWDGPTRDGLLHAYGQDLLGKLPAGLADDLLVRLLFKPKGGVAGLYGLGATASMPGAGATHIRLPPAVAKYVAEDASAWVLRTKEAPADQSVVLQKGTTTQLDPALITGKVPKKKTAKKAAVNTSNVSNNTRSNTNSNTSSNTKSNTSNIRNVTNESNITNVTNTTNASSSAEAAPDAGPMPVGPMPLIGGDPNSLPPDIAPAPAPEQPTLPVTPPPVEKSNSFFWFLGGAAAIGLGVVLNKEKKPAQKKLKRPGKPMKHKAGYRMTKAHR